MKRMIGWLVVAMAVANAVGSTLGQDVKAGSAVLSQKPRYTLADNAESAWCVAFSPDGRTLASCGGNRDAKAGQLLAYDLTKESPTLVYIARERTESDGSPSPWTARPWRRPGTTAGSGSATSTRARS